VQTEQSQRILCKQKNRKDIRTVRRTIYQCQTIINFFYRPDGKILRRFILKQQWANQSESLVSVEEKEEKGSCYMWFSIL